MQFADVSGDTYYYDPVSWTTSEGITTGTSESTFSPDSFCNRAQAVTFIWRAMGSQQPMLEQSNFVDISPDVYYYHAVLWAVEQGITTGTSAETFSPNIEVTRAQVVTLLWRATGGDAVVGESPFDDVVPGAFYETAVNWAVENAITNGIFGHAVWKRCDLLKRSDCNISLPLLRWTEAISAE